jgi:hypothetical protein
VSEVAGLTVGPIGRLRMMGVDFIILVLQVVMLAVTATTSPPEVVEVITTVDLDRVERGVTMEEGDGDEIDGVGDDGLERNEMMERNESEEEEDRSTVVRVGVTETIRTLWDSDAPLIRRFR